MEKHIEAFIKRSNEYISEESIKFVLSHVFRGLCEIEKLIKQDITVELENIQAREDLSFSNQYCVVQDSNMGRIIWVLSGCFAKVATGSMLFGESSRKGSISTDAEHNAIQDLIMQVSEEMSFILFDDEPLELYPCKVQQGFSVEQFPYLQIHLKIKIGSLDYEDFILNIPCEMGQIISSSSTDIQDKNQLFVKFDNIETLKDKLEFYSGAGYLFKSDCIKCFFLNCAATSHIKGRDSLKDMLQHSPNAIVSSLFSHSYIRGVEFDANLGVHSHQAYMKKVKRHLNLIDALFEDSDLHIILPTISNSLFVDGIQDYISHLGSDQVAKDSQIPDYCRYYIDQDRDYKTAILDNESLCYQIVLTGMAHLLNDLSPSSLEYEFELLSIGL